MTFGQVIRQKRKELRLTLDEVAAKTGFSKPYLSTIETGRVKNPPSDELICKLEKILRFKSGYLLHLAHKEKIPADIRREFETLSAENRKYRTLIQNILTRRQSISELHKLFRQGDPDALNRTPGNWIPVINKVAAGYPNDFDDLGYPAGVADDYVLAPDLHDPNAFALRVVGDSMEPEFRQGDIVIFSPAAPVQSGADCLIRLQNPYETTFKRVFFDSKDEIRLQPRNEKYPPQIIRTARLNGLYRAVIQYRRL
ncbi:MAG TPA: S24 family peptidase [Anaerohalosphaeraceae bacterium]|nr:S24 family peptidase [Anaerohalosphaeraceae bacterium]